MLREMVSNLELSMYIYCSVSVHPQTYFWGAMGQQVQ